MICFLAGLNASDWIAIGSLIAAIASLYVAWRSFVVGKTSLDVAKKMMEDADEDWAQQKWFDLYVKADDAFNLLDRFRQVHLNDGKYPAQKLNDWNEVMIAIRQAHTRALVFPKNPAIDKFLAATSVFNDILHGYDAGYLKSFLDGTEDLRDMAKLKPGVLNRPKIQ